MNLSLQNLRVEAIHGRASLEHVDGALHGARAQFQTRFLERCYFNMTGTIWLMAWHSFGWLVTK